MSDLAALERKVLLGKEKRKLKEPKTTIASTGRAKQGPSKPSHIQATGPVDLGLLSSAKAMKSKPEQAQASPSEPKPA